jgi:hypothetical protein
VCAAHGDLARRRFEVADLAALLALPREALDIEAKGWLDLEDEDHKEDLAKAMLALANHGGGFVLIGFTLQAGQLSPAPNPPADLSAYDQDRVQKVVDRYAEPPFQCDVHHIQSPATPQLHPIIVVPGGHRVPLRAKSEGPNRKHLRINSYYIRRPGPKSETPQSGREWDELISRCVRNNREDLLEALTLVLEGRALEKMPTGSSHLDEWFDASQRRFQDLLQDDPVATRRHSKGNFAIAYSLSGKFAAPRLNELPLLLRTVSANFTGWPVWAVLDVPGVAPQAFEGTAECWLASLQDSDTNSDFWRARPHPDLFLVRNYKEDFAEHEGSRPFLDVSLPVQRVAEWFLHAHRLALALEDPDAVVELRAEWRGLAGRVLVPWARPSLDLRVRRPAIQDTVRVRAAVVTREISDGLPELVRDLLRDLYTAFDFFEPPLSFVQDEINRLRSRLPF